MARKTQTRDIGDNTYRATQLKVRKANRVLLKIVKLVGETAGTLADNVGSGETDPAVALMGDFRKGGLGDAAAKFAGALEEDDLNWLVEELRPSVEYQTPELRASTPEGFVPMSGDLWDDVFAGEILDQFKVLAFILELNFGSFFAGVGGLRGAVRRFVTPTSNASTSPKTGNGGSGGS